jgi:hypothetical protein
MHMIQDYGGTHCPAVRQRSSLMPSTADPGTHHVAAEAERDPAIQQALNLLSSDTYPTIAYATITAVSIPGVIIDHA